MAVMRVEFYKDDKGRICGWVATPPKRRTFQGTTMAAGRSLSHDLMQFVVERALGIREGFWGLLAHGAWFASVPGLRPTRPGRELVRAHYAGLIAAEGVVNGHYIAWRRGEATPVGPELDATFARWQALGEGERLVMEWPVLPLENESSRRATPRLDRRALRPAPAHVRR